jgi:DNA polymerase-3 subunit alpha
MPNYVNLHTHTYYSPLDGLNSPKEYFQRAKELGMTHLAITDHETLSGHREAQKAAEEEGVIPILGLEGYFSETDRFDKRSKAKREDGTSIYNHLTILSQNETGLQTLNRLSEIAWSEGYFYKPRIDFELLEDHNENLVVLSGCMSGVIAKAILREDFVAADVWAKKFKDLLGDRFFIEVMSSNDPELNHHLLKIADANKIGPVMTTDCHYARPEDLWVEEAMLILSTSPKMDRATDLSKAKKMDILDRLDYLYPGRTMTFREIEIYLRDYQTEKDKFVEQGITRDDIYENTLRIAETVGEYPYFEGLDLLPNPGNDNPDRVLRSKALAGLRRRGIDEKEGYLERLEDELKIIKDKEFSTYFLIVEDAIRWAKENNIMVGPGRGSAAGSLLCYALGITDIDPIEYGLLFFRFIDPSRNDFPDIDVDFADRGREQVKEYVRRKYKHVASIATFNMFGGKSSIKDAGRALGIPVAEVNRATKDNDEQPGTDFFDHFLSSDKGREFHRKHPEVVGLAKALHGKLRGRGIHAAGLVVSKEPLERYVPIETARNPSDPNGARIRYVACDMNTAADIGLIKMDFLGLKTLSVIQDCLDDIALRHKRRIDILEIPRDDKNVFHMLSKGYTKGVFQCEAVPYTNLILKMGGVWSFDELVASNALVRPGAMNTIGAEYIARKNGSTDVYYAHKDTKWFTEDTYGEVLYQEQVMLMMTELAGMSMVDANKVRKIIGKKQDPVEFEKYRQKFIDGASTKVKKKVAEKLWKDFEAHAGYSFNKSHAVAYSLVSYVTAWLKYHYPLEFMAAVLRNEKDKDAITDYLIETKRLGIKVLLPHVNESRLKIAIQGDAIRLGLTNIKFIQDKTGQALIDHRPFQNYAQLMDKAMEKGSGINSRMLMAMNAIGAAVFSDNPKRGDERDNFYEYLQIPAFEVKDLEPTVKFKFRPLDEYGENEVFPVLAMVRGIKRGEGWARVEVVDETGSAGIFADQDTLLETGQMYAILVANNRVARFMTMDELNDRVSTEFSRYMYDEVPEMQEGEYRVISFKKYVTKAGKVMAHLVLLDHLGKMDFVMAFPAMYKDAYLKCPEGRVVKLEVKETNEGGTLFIDKILK